MMKAWQHFKTITTHKMWVMRYCFKIGLYWQGLTHDLSKYSPTEFLVGMKYYQGDRSPNNAEREDTGMSKSWMHHKGRNKHHFEYWIDYGINCDNKIVRSDTCSGYNLIQHMWIDQKILTILFLKYKAVLLQYGYCILRLPEPRFYFLHKFSMYLELKVFLVKNHAVVRIGMLSGHASSEFTGSLFCMGDGTIHHIFDL